MRIPFTLALTLLCALAAIAQVPVATGIQILKAEDARRYDNVLENLMKTPNPAVRVRAALAAGRIGDDRALTALTVLLEKDASIDVRSMAAFAIGEIESIKGADAVLAGLKREASTKPLNDRADPQARLVEAAGKIAAANPKDPKSAELGAAILDVLRQEPEDRLTVLLGITALLRARPAGGAVVVAKYVSHTDATVRADALNTLARLRSFVGATEVRKLLANDRDPIVRANAARFLGAADDKEALDLLLDAAANDIDGRVRVAAIRSLGQLKAVRSADALVARGEVLMVSAKRSRYKHPSESAEMIEIATVLGRLLPGTGNERAVKFLDAFALMDRGLTPEVSIARMHIKPSGDFDNSTGDDIATWHELATDAQLLGEIADLNPPVYADTPEIRKLKEDAPGLLFGLVSVIRDGSFTRDKKAMTALPDVLTAYAKFKTNGLDEVLRNALESPDVFVRATAAGLIADRPPSQENADALSQALSRALLSDKHDNDAQLSIMEAFAKVAGRNSISALTKATYATDFLVRKKAAELLRGLPGWSDTSTDKSAEFLVRTTTLKPFDPQTGTKLGQVLNTDADYRRALSRRNGTTRAVLTTEKGTFTIEFTPEEAPLTVDNFVKLARAGYFNGLEAHRVVPNFVMQDGDPRGDGNGGPGWSIRCEVNMLPYDRGAVGMALSGKDTGGSQWFVTHSPQPHLDGGYTVFGHVAEKDMKVVDSIVRGDRILTVKIIGR